MNAHARKSPLQIEATTHQVVEPTSGPVAEGKWRRTHRCGFRKKWRHPRCAGFSQTGAIAQIYPPGHTSPLLFLSSAACGPTIADTPSPDSARSAFDQRVHPRIRSGITARCAIIKGYNRRTYLQSSACMRRAPPPPPGCVPKLMRAAANRDCAYHQPGPPGSEGPALAPSGRTSSGQRLADLSGSVTSGLAPAPRRSLVGSFRLVLCWRPSAKATD